MRRLPFRSDRKAAIARAQIGFGNMKVLESTLTCPECGHIKTEPMPTDACQWFYECEHCLVVLTPKPGDCCVYCSFGTEPCPPQQQGNV